MMMRYLMVLAALGLPLSAVELDTAGVGRDLNGWQEDRVAWFGIEGLSFRAAEPVTRLLGGGSVEVTMRIEQVARKTPVYVADIRLIASTDGLVRVASITGRVDGSDFSSGEVTRPEMATVGETEEGNDGGAVDVTPINAEKEMRDELAQVLDSAIDRARTGDRARHDLASRIFGTKAGDVSSLTKATGLAVRSLFRRLGP